MYHDFGVVESDSLALCAARQKKGSEARREPDADGGHVALDVLHGVVNREACRNRAAGAVDIELNVSVRILRLQKQHLRNDQAGGTIRYLLAEKDDSSDNSRENIS